jgi:dienelactone hydrolase
MQSRSIVPYRDLSRATVWLVPALAVLGMTACSSSSHDATGAGSVGSGGERGTLSSSGTGATTASSGTATDATSETGGFAGIVSGSGSTTGGTGTGTTTGGADAGAPTTTVTATGGSAAGAAGASGTAAGSGGARVTVVTVVTVGTDAGVTTTGPSPDAGSSTGTGSGTATPGIMRGPDPTTASASTQGPYTVKTYTSGFKDEPNFAAATIYYPTDADAPFAAVAICPGFTATQSSINTWGPFLASHGIVVMTIDTNSTTDSVVQRSTALLDALDSLKAENDRSGGPLMGKVDTSRMGLMGWSMGGGGTWIDANTHPELKTAITMAGHIITAPGGTGAITTISVPTLMFAGQDDSAILGGGMSQPIYTQIPDSVPKMLYEVAGAGHDVANSPANNVKNIGLYGLSWQKVFLEGDTRYRQFLLVKGPNASDFRTNLK